MELDVQSTMCRICMRSDPDILYGLFDHTVDAWTLAEVVSLVGAVQVFLGDSLPDMCCAQCLVAVEAAYQLRHLCQESDQRLRNMFHPPEIVKKELFGSDLKWLEAGPVWLPEETVSHRQQTSSKERTAGALKNEYQTQTKQNIVVVAEPNEKPDEMEDDDNDDEGSLEDQDEEAEGSQSLPQKIDYRNVPKTFDEYPAVKFRCCACKFTSNQLENLRVHGRERHCNIDLRKKTLKDKQCDICYKSLINKRSYNFHRKNIMYNYRCQICGIILITRLEACTHYRVKHGQKKLTADEALVCCGCEKRFPSADALRAHSEMVHLPEKPPPDEKKPVSCNTCFRSFLTKGVLRQHKTRYLARSKDFLCNECGKTYITALALAQHEAIHRGKKLQCPKCPRVYATPHTLRTHIYTHSQPVDKFKCAECQRIFKKKAALVEHARFHSDERPFKCDTCEKTFKSKNGLHEHARVHSDERPFKCTGCDKSFKTKTTLDQHAVIHSGTRSFRCPKCPASFFRYANLYAHAVTHTGEKRFSCHLCEKRFVSKCALKNHVLCIHEKVKMFTCEHCPKRFYKKINCIGHMKRMHTSRQAKVQDSQSTAKPDQRATKKTKKQTEALAYILSRQPDFPQYIKKEEKIEQKIANSQKNDSVTDAVCETAERTQTPIFCIPFQTIVSNKINCGSQLIFYETVVSKGKQNMGEKLEEKDARAKSVEKKDGNGEKKHTTMDLQDSQLTAKPEQRATKKTKKQAEALAYILSRQPDFPQYIKKEVKIQKKIANTQKNDLVTDAVCEIAERTQELEKKNAKAKSVEKKDGNDEKKDTTMDSDTEKVEENDRVMVKEHATTQNDQERSAESKKDEQKSCKI